MDGFGRRVAVKDDGTLTEGFLYLDQLRPTAWLGSNGDIKATFLYLTGRIAPDLMVMANGTDKYRLIQDERGSVVKVIDVSDGSVEQSISYDPWGVVLSDSAPGFQPFGYAGGIHDQVTKLTHFGAREYHPTTGRFLQRDPIEGQTGDPYAYASSDPVNYIDPTGHSSWLPDWMNESDWMSGWRTIISDPSMAIPSSLNVNYGCIFRNRVTPGTGGGFSLGARIGGGGGFDPYLDPAYGIDGCALVILPEWQVEKPCDCKSGPTYNVTGFLTKNGKAGIGPAMEYEVGPCKEMLGVGIGVGYGHGLTDSVDAPGLWGL